MILERSPGLREKWNAELESAEGRDRELAHWRREAGGGPSTFCLTLAANSCDAAASPFERSPIEMKISRLRVLFAVAALSTLVASPALAYLDPATGNFILQTVIAGVFGAYLFFKMNLKALRERIQGLFGSRKTGARSESSDQAEE
jgi:hypothetical protein